MIDLAAFALSSLVFKHLHISIKIRQKILQFGENYLEAGEIRKGAVNKSEWRHFFVMSKNKSLQKDLLSKYDDDDDFIDNLKKNGIKHRFIIVENQLFLKIGYNLLQYYTHYGKKIYFIVIYKIF